MSSVTEIELAIAKLPPLEMAKLRAWFAEFDGEWWDKQIEEDAASGKLDALADEAFDDHRNGRTTDL